MSSSAHYNLPAVTDPSRRLRARASRAISDVAMVHTDDGGDIVLLNGAVVMSDGLFNFVYLCLFGGNEDDPALSNTSKMWWGNFSELDQSRWLRSETQYLLNTLAPNTSNLRRLEGAVKNDLAVLVSEGIATDVQAIVSMPAPKSVQIDIATRISPNVVERFDFTRNWSGNA